MAHSPPLHGAQSNAVDGAVAVVVVVASTVDVGEVSVVSAPSSASSVHAAKSSTTRVSEGHQRERLRSQHEDSSMSYSAVPQAVLRPTSRSWAKSAQTRPPISRHIWASGASTEGDRCPEECAPSSVDAGRFSCDEESLGMDIQMPTYLDAHTMDGLVADEIYVSEGS